MIDENLLIKESIKGNEEFFKILIDTHKNYIFAIILNFIKDYNEVENIAQETFLQIHKSLPNYKEDNFKGWIGRIASNKSIDYLRKKRSTFNEETLKYEDLVEIVKASEENSPENILLEKENRRILLDYLNNIPDIYKKTLEKFYFQDKSYEEIAKEEGVSQKTIASRLYRGKAMIKEKWRDKNEAF